MGRSEILKGLRRHHASVGWGMGAYSRKIPGVGESRGCRVDNGPWPEILKMEEKDDGIM